MRTIGIAFSVFGIPALGLASLVICLWHPKVNLEAAAKGPETVYLMQPSARLDRSMTVFLKQEAKNVTYSRTHDGPKMQAQTVANYNIVACECTPAVFEATHLPPVMGF